MNNLALPPKPTCRWCGVILIPSISEVACPVHMDRLTRLGEAALRLFDELAPLVEGLR